MNSLMYELLKEGNMKKKKIYPILTVLLLVVFCTIALMFTGCSLDQQLWDAREEAKRNAAEQAAKEEQQKKLEEEKVIAAEIAALEEEVIAAEEAEEREYLESLPNEPITYTGSIGKEGQVPIAVILIVDFKTKEVTGSLSYGGPGINTYVDATITDGKIIDLLTLEIATKYSGVAGSKQVEGSAGVEYQINGIITGTITYDLGTFNGEMSSEEGAQKFTATRK